MSEGAGGSGGGGRGPRARSAPDQVDATLLILAGGRGSRMGGPKHLRPFRGTTLLEWTRARLGPEFAETLVCGVDVSDRHPGAGPLAGIEAGLAAASRRVAFAVACDMPRVKSALARDLVELLGDADAVVPRVDGRAEPACAAYARSALVPITTALDAGERRASALLERLRVRWIDEAELRARGHDPEDLVNVNTPEELAREEKR